MVRDISALAFTGTDVVNFGTPANINNVCMTKGTMMAIVWRNSWAAFTGGGLILKNVLNNTFQFTWGQGGTPDIQVLMDRATTDLRASTTGTQLTVIGAQKWVVVAIVFDSAGANGDQRIYAGDERTPIVEATSYSVQTVGSGTVTDTSANPLYVGNNSALNFGVNNGQIAFVGMWSTVLSLADLRQQYNAIWQWLQQGGTDNPVLWPGCVLASHLGRQGNSVALDVSGKGNHGSVSGTTTWQISPQPV